MDVREQIEDVAVAEEAAEAEPLSAFRINEKSVVPIWIQIRKRLVYLISVGKFERGERLPSVRELSVRLGVNYNTVNKVYQDLERDGYIYTQRGRGTYVSDLKGVKLSAVDGDVEALAIDFVQQALTRGMSAEDIHDLVSEQLILLGGAA
ncbi:GntR family transcriptional regulator [uncultured Adlercreutzia sp.]|uniref:GntR family transcriptional regulator n=1 Tax=uncultured Adlercreutzia sp. TaxID=875803 RepID=UPI0026766DC7|nr:GntR family transcriptional regulator [uncultured Adlercreutzia sp.]